MNIPNSTQVPNEVFDALLPTLTEGELKVFLYLIRRTLGFRKIEDTISLPQFEHGIKGLDVGCGLKRRRIIYSLKSLIKKGLIVHKKGLGVPSLYSIVFSVGSAIADALPGVGGSAKSSIKVVQQLVHPQNKEQNKERQDPFVSEVIQFIFDDWKRTMKLNGRALLTPARAEKIKARLKDSTLDEIMIAIASCGESPFHQGENDRRTPYNDLADHILKNREKVEKWVSRWQANGGGKVKFGERQKQWEDLRQRWEAAYGR